MRIVVRSALLFVLMVTLPSIASAQSRYYSNRPADGVRQYNGQGYERGSQPGRYVPLPRGWTYEPDDGRDGVPAGTQEAEGDSRYGETADTGGSDESDVSRDGESTLQGESSGGETFSGNPDALEGEGGYGPAGTAEGVGAGDHRYGETTGGFQEFGDDRSYRAPRGYRSTAKIRGRVINCYIDRRGRTICP